MKTIKTLIISLILSSIIIGCSDKPTLYVYNWSDYISEEYIRQFEAKYDCKVDVTSFDSNEAMYAKLKAGATGFDIVFPSSYQVQMMVNEDLIEELDHSKLPNVFANFDHSYDNQILDPTCRYSIPYVVTYTGFLYKKDKFQQPPESWNILSDNKLQMKISLLDDIREVIGAGLMYNGFSINSENEEEIDIAVNTVLEWKKKIRKFDSESYRTEVPNGSSWLGHGYSSDSAQAIIGEGSPREDIAFCLPKEGFTIAWDEIVILKSAENKDLAYHFINDLYLTENAKDNMEYVCGVMPQTEAIKLLDDNIKNMFIFPEDIMKKGQVLKSFVDKPEVQEIYNKAWDKIKAIKE